jgi:hypothetical protein
MVGGRADPEDARLVRALEGGAGGVDAGLDLLRRVDGGIRRAEL